MPTYQKGGSGTQNGTKKGTEKSTKMGSLSGPLLGTRLIPIGTLYDPFIARGLDSLNYACYQDARFMLVATPAGIL